MTTGRIISSSSPTPPLMRQVLFNCNRVFSGFGFIFSNLKRVWMGTGIVIPTPPRLYFKNIFYYFILYFNINNNNN